MDHNNEGGYATNDMPVIFSDSNAQDNNNNSTNIDGQNNTEHRNIAQNAGSKLKLARTALLKTGGYPAILFVCSVILLIASAVVCCKGLSGYTLAVGIVSAVACCILIFLDRNERLEPKMRIIATTLLFLWWTVGACVATFSGPFVDLGNGFFASWGGLIVSLVMVINDVAKARDAMERIAILSNSAAILIVGGLFVIIAGSTACNPFGCTGLDIFAIIWGVITVIIGVAQIALSSFMDERINKILGIFLILFWVVGFMCLTFIGPFQEVRNGYIGALVCLMASLSLV